jgi:hypothetical protein
MTGESDQDRDRDDIYNKNENPGDVNDEPQGVRGGDARERRIMRQT